jgi:hypothetical protein
VLERPSVRNSLSENGFLTFMLQDEEVWARVVDYIRLNLLCACVVEPDEHLDLPKITNS